MISPPNPNFPFCSSNIILKVRQPTTAEVDKIAENSTVISYLYPAQNKELLDKLAARKITAFGMDCVPRISRAQVGAE